MLTNKRVPCADAVDQFQEDDEFPDLCLHCLESVIMDSGVTDLAGHGSYQGNKLAKHAVVTCNTLISVVTPTLTQRSTYHRVHLVSGAEQHRHLHVLEGVDDVVAMNYGGGDVNILQVTVPHTHCRLVFGWKLRNMATKTGA